MTSVFGRATAIGRRRLGWALAASLLVHLGAYLVAVTAHFQLPPMPVEPPPPVTRIVLTKLPPTPPPPTPSPTPPPHRQPPVQVKPAVAVRVHTYHAKPRQHVTMEEPPPPPNAAIATVPPATPDALASVVAAVVASAPPIAPSTPGPAAPPTVAPGAMAAWEAQIVAKLERAKRYPESARLREQQGIVYLRVTIDENGRVTEFGIERGSGVDALDREVVSLIGRVQPLPAPPANATMPLQFVVPIVFSMQRLGA